MSSTNEMIYPPNCKEITEDLGKETLVHRLKSLARAFKDMGQEDNEQYTSLARYLATSFFIEHTSKDIRLLTACCLADVFRVFAPEAPYSEPQQLKEIFMFFIKQLRGLEDTSSASFKLYFYLLENLAWVKTFNICIELEDSQDIFCHLYRLMFSIVNEKHIGKVVNFMLDMMTPLITESDSISPELLDVILLNLVEPQKNINRVAYNMARDLIKRTSNALEPYIQSFYNTLMILDKSSESELADHSFELIYELNSIAPNVLLSVLPQLEFKLKSSEEIERRAVTKLLAEMFSEINSTLATQHRPLWTCFLGRFNDISVNVRLICVQFAPFFILHHSELASDITEQLKVRQHDPDEAVRSEVVSGIISAAKKDFSRISNELLDFIKERTLDKKFKIRREALLGLSSIYKQVHGHDRPNPEDVERTKWIKDKVFHAYYQKSPEDRLLVERIFNMSLVPYSLSSDNRMKKLLLLYVELDEPAQKAVTEMLKSRLAAKTCLAQLLEVLQKDDEGRAPAVSLIHPKIFSLAKHLPDHSKLTDHLKQFSQIIFDDPRVRRYLLAITGVDYTVAKAQEAVKEVLKKMGNPNQTNHFYATVKAILERTAPVMIDRESIDILVRLVQDSVVGISDITAGKPQAMERGVQLLHSLSWAFPHCFDSEVVFSNLITMLKHEDQIVEDTTIQIFTNVGSNLHTGYPQLYTSLLPVLQHCAKMGTPKQAKHAINCLDKICDKKNVLLMQIAEHFLKNFNPDSANYITSLVSLGHIALLCPDEIAEDFKAFVSQKIVKDLLMKDRGEGVLSQESWIPDHKVSEETQAKVQALKLMVRWLLGLKQNAGHPAISTLRLLKTIIVNDGDLMEQNLISKAELARLRLQAGCCMLKLAEEQWFAKMITLEQFQTLAFLINDNCYEVRRIFTQKLHKGLLSLRLPLEYMGIFSLCANDSQKERRAQAKQFLNMNIFKRREFLRQNSAAMNKMVLLLPDYVVPYAIHLLAHDPDLTGPDNVEALRNIKECLWFLMEPLMARGDDFNYSFYRRMIENIKQTKDAQDPDDEESNVKLYCVCDIALGLLGKSSNIVLKDVTAEPVLPKKLFTNPDESYSNTKCYLPVELRAELPKHEVWQTGVTRDNKPVTTTTIIVDSPKPVINPFSRMPRVRDPVKEQKKRILDQKRAMKTEKKMAATYKSKRLKQPEKSEVKDTQAKLDSDVEMAESVPEAADTSPTQPGDSSNKKPPPDNSRIRRSSRKRVDYNEQKEEPEENSPLSETKTSTTSKNIKPESIEQKSPSRPTPKSPAKTLSPTRQHSTYFYKHSSVDWAVQAQKESESDETASPPSVGSPNAVEKNAKTETPNTRRGSKQKNITDPSDASSSQSSALSTVTSPSPTKKSTKPQPKRPTASVSIGKREAQPKITDHLQPTSKQRKTLKRGLANGTSDGETVESESAPSQPTPNDSDEGQIQIRRKVRPRRK